MKYFPALLAVALIALPSPAQERVSFGEQLSINGGELFYKDSVEKSEAKRLGEYLKANKFYDGTPKSAQLAKSGKTYQFRIVVKTGLENDADVVKNMKLFAGQISEDVFKGAPVEIHLCDPKFRTLRTVIMTGK